jgi:nitrite reductase/ring-hydroxylating ferredoxin subunit
VSDTDVANEWSVLEDVDAESAEFPLTANVEGERIVVFKSAAGLHAIQRRCPHQSADMSKKGSAIKLNNQIVFRCALHGIVFRASDGKSINFPSVNATVYEVAEEGNQIKVRRSSS